MGLKRAALQCPRVSSPASSLQIYRRWSKVPYQGAGEGKAVQAGTSLGLNPASNVY